MSRCCLEAQHYAMYSMSWNASFPWGTMCLDACRSLPRLGDCSSCPAKDKIVAPDGAITSRSSVLHGVSSVLHGVDFCVMMNTCRKSCSRTVVAVNRNWFKYQIIQSHWRVTTQYPTSSETCKKRCNFTQFLVLSR